MPFRFWHKAEGILTKFSAVESNILESKMLLKSRILVTFYELAGSQTFARAL